MPRDERLRFFVDETSLGVARALALVRGDVVHPGHRRLMPDVPEGTKDPDWMPVIADLGLVVISRDRHIKTKPAELDAYRALSLRAFWIAGDRDLGNWENLTRLVKWWPTIERLIDGRGAGPWFYALNLTNVTELGIPQARTQRGSSKPNATPAPLLDAEQPDFGFQTAHRCRRSAGRRRRRAEPGGAEDGALPRGPHRREAVTTAATL